MNRTDLTVASGPDADRQEQTWESEGGALAGGSDARGAGTRPPVQCRSNVLTPASTLVAIGR